MTTKERITCRNYCNKWNDIDRDCEIYGEHHPCPRNCPFYKNELIIEDNTPHIGKTNDLYEQNQEYIDTIAELSRDIERLQKQLDIAVAGLQYYVNEDIYIENHKVVNGNNEWTSEVMLDKGVKASYFLKKIKDLNK